MLKINTNFNKCKIPIITAIMASCSTLALFSYLTYIPNPTFATDSTINPTNTTARSDTATDQRTLMNIKYMQQMSDQICTNTKENKTKQLIGIRDGKSYWVTKLKDGNCWMTQNLAYNGGGTSRGTNCSGWTNDNTVAQYCNPGHTNGDHASRGNYYSWPAAMNGDTFATGTVQGICSNGWHLPTSNNTAKGSFDGLTTAYGAGNNSAGSTIMRGSPMYFQYSGNAYSSGIYDVGSRGYYWSSTPSGSTYAYRLYLYSSGANPSDDNYLRYNGYSVRCLAN